MSVPPLDLVAYLRRIGHTGEQTPTVATLGAVIERHAATIPLENLDPLLGVVPNLSDGLRGISRNTKSRGSL